MPYIILKRDDIPAGILQVLDLDPNTSQRNYTLDPPGQTKYVDAVQNDAVVTAQPAGAGTPVVLHREARGLAAWFITNVNDGSGARAEGTFTIAVGNAALTSAEVDTSAVGGPVLGLTFVVGAPADPTEVQIGADNDETAANLGAAIADPLNGVTPYVEVEVADNVVTLNAVQVGTEGNSITLDSVGADIAAVGLAGGAFANILTAAQANAVASNILANLLAFGDLTTAAIDMDLAALDAELVAVVATADLDEDQVSQILDILAGRQYVVPKGVQVASNNTRFAVSPSVGDPGGPGFVAGTLRPIFQTGSLSLSAGVGVLSQYTSRDFVYGGLPTAQAIAAGTAFGEAVVLYNDDGTLYTP